MPSPSVAKRRQQAGQVAAALAQGYPSAVCALVHKNPLELLIATILSAQCTDVRVNLVTKDLFHRYATSADLACASQEELEAAIKSTGFFRNKARNIIACCQELVSRHGGAVPSRMEDLVVLPGVGRKTANVVLGTAFGVATGVVVDTHVTRLSRRLGLSRQSQPEAIEQDLMRHLAQEEWINFSHRLILHGRAICTARQPRCDKCMLLKLCPRVGLPGGRRER